MMWSGCCLTPEQKQMARSSQEGDHSMSHSRASIVGTWRITSMTEWDQDFVDEEVPGYYEFKKHRRGEFQFGYVHCGIDWQESERNGQPAVEFSFEGMDEMTPTSGRGWAILNGDTLDGMIFFHQGDESGFTAQRQ